MVDYKFNNNYEMCNFYDSNYKQEEYLKNDYSFINIQNFQTINEIINGDICNFYDINYKDEKYFTNDITFVDLYNLQNIESFQRIREDLKKIEKKPKKNIATIKKLNELKNKLNICEKNNKKHFFINKNF